MISFKAFTQSTSTSHPTVTTHFLERIMLDTQAQALLQLMVERKVPAVNTLPPEKAREFYLVRKALTQPDPPPGIFHHRPCPAVGRCQRAHP